jgi:hypothetical protein
VTTDHLAVWVIATFCIAELIKNAVYEPMVLGGTVKLHPLVSVIGVSGGAIPFWPGRRPPRDPYYLRVQGFRLEHRLATQDLWADLRGAANYRLATPRELGGDARLHSRPRTM